MYISEEQLNCILNTIEKCTSNNIPTIILSIVSVVAAIFVPNFIAYQQNEIALYDKRLEAYQQFLILKDFYEFIKKPSLYDDQDEATVISRWGGMYLSLHYSMLDKSYQQNHIILQPVYVLAAINRDKNMISSLEYLRISNNEDVLKRASVTLENFVKALFTKPNEKEGQELQQKKEEFEKAFLDLMNYEKNFEKMLKLPNVFSFNRMKGK